MKANATARQGWQAHLDLLYQQRERSTFLARRRHHGPLLVQRPFYPEDGVCHSYIIHPPGGVVGGDQLQIDVRVQQGAHALLTTPASGKFYNSQAYRSQLNQHFIIETDAVLEWLPQDNIFFEGAHASLCTHIELARRAHFIGWEISCLGRPSSNAMFDHGDCHQRLLLTREGRPLLVDNTFLQAGHDMLTAKWGLDGHNVTATLLATGADQQLVDALRSGLAVSADSVFSVTLIDDVLLCRFLGQHGEAARHLFARAWDIIRPHVLGIPACPPRIWKT